MTPFHVLAPIALGVGALAASCQPAPHEAITCDTYEVSSRIDCVDGPTGDVVVSFDADLHCAQEDDCSIDYRRQDADNITIVITKATG